MKSRIAIPVLVGAILFVGLAGFVGYRVYQKKSEAAGARTGRERPAVAVEVEEIQRGTIRDIASLTGSLEPASRFVVAPKIGGRIDRLLVNIGDSVQRGQVVATLDAEEYEQAVRQAEAELAVARANAEDTVSARELARSDLKRVTELHTGKIASDAELDAAQGRFSASDAKVKMADAQVEQRAAALKSAQVRLSYTQITADWQDGSDQRVIGERYADPGNTIPANSPIVLVLDLEKMLAVVNIIERDYSQITIGQSAIITTDAFPRRAFEGRIERVAPVLRETTRQARVEVAVPNPDKLLKPGMFVRAQIELAQHDSAVLAPQSAVIRRDGESGLFVLDASGSKVRFVKVKLGIVQGDKAEVLEPAVEGKVVTLGQHLLEDGAPVRLPGAVAAPAGAEGTGRGSRNPAGGGAGKRAEGGAQRETGGRPAGAGQ